MFQIIEYNKELSSRYFQIKTYLNIFCSDKRILHFLFENEIVQFDKKVMNKTD